MELDDLKHKYQSLPLRVRLIMALVIGLMPALYIYFDEGSGLSEDLEAATLKEQSARGVFENARKQKAKLPQLEEQLAFTEGQMVKARQYLPEVFRVEEVLHKVSEIAKDTGVDLVNFLPREEVKLDKGYPVVEIPVSAEVLGRYMNIATFIDRIVHLDSTVFVKSIQMVLDTPAGPEQGPGGGGQVPLGSREVQSKEARNQVHEKATLVLAAYRSQTPAEVAGAAPANANGPNGPNGSNGPNGPQTPQGQPPGTPATGGVPPAGKAGGPP